MSLKVIYITGQAYSGSTFLCALLGTHPDMEPVSELSKWTTKDKKTNRYCACGKWAKDCEFWVAVEESWLGQNRPDSLKRYEQLQNKYETISSLWKTALSKSFATSSDFREFEEMTVALYRSISMISGHPIIVDSSKLPGRALMLSKMIDLDLSIIHLVRGGLRYLESSLRREKKISLNDPNLLYRTFRLGVRWSNTNFAAEWALTTSKVKGVRIRYEDLVSKPIETLESVSSALEIDLLSIQKHIDANRPISFRHMASGSGHRKEGAKPLMKEFNTLNNMDRRLKLSFYLGAAFLSRRYGYL
jgi:hypothetical protein